MRLHKVESWIVTVSTAEVM